MIQLERGDIVEYAQLELFPEFAEFVGRKGVFVNDCPIDPNYVWVMMPNDDGDYQMLDRRNLEIKQKQHGTAERIKE